MAAWWVAPPDAKCVAMVAIISKSVRRSDGVQMKYLITTDEPNTWGERWDWMSLNCAWMTAGEILVYLGSEEERRTRSEEKEQEDAKGSDCDDASQSDNDMLISL